MVVDKVLKSPYIDGVQKYLIDHFKRQKFIIVTNTPKIEIELILKTLGIVEYFKDIFGAPDFKTKIVREFLDNKNIDANDCVFIGDSPGDFKAAFENSVPFIYRGEDQSDCYENCLMNFQF